MPLRARHYAGIIRRGVFASSASLVRGSSCRSKLRGQGRRGGEDSGTAAINREEREDESFAFLRARNVTSHLPAMMRMMHHLIKKKREREFERAACSVISRLIVAVISNNAKLIP